MKKPLLFGATTLLLAAACSSKTEPRGQLMLSMQTDLSLPKDVDTVRIEVSTFGKVHFAQDYPVGPNGAKIPATLGVLAGSDKTAPVRIRVIAKLGATSRLLREAVTTVPAARVASLRMPLQFLSLGQVVETGTGPVGTARASGVQLQGVGTLDGTSSGEPVADPVRSSCGDDMTSDNGTCVSVNVDSEKLPDYEPAEVFGGGDETGAGGVCFDTVKAFENGSDGVVNMDECAVYRTVSGTTNVGLLVAPGKGGICSEGNTKCYVPLDAESESGWRSENGRIKLPPAVCAKLKDGSVTSVLASDDYFVQKKPGTPTCGPWSGVTTPASAPPDGGAPIVSGGSEGGVSVDASLPDATTGGRDASIEPPDAAIPVEAGDGVDSGLPFTDSGVIVDPKLDSGLPADGGTGVDAGMLVDGGAPGAGVVIKTGVQAYSVMVDSSNANVYAQLYNGVVEVNDVAKPFTWIGVVGARTGIATAAGPDHYSPRMAFFNYPGSQILRTDFIGDAAPHMYSQTLPVMTAPTAITPAHPIYAIATFGGSMALAKTGSTGYGLYTCSFTSCSGDLATKVYTPPAGTAIGRMVMPSASQLIWTESTAGGKSFDIKSCSFPSCTTVATVANVPSNESPYLAMSPSGNLFWSETQFGSQGKIHTCFPGDCTPTTIASGQSLDITTPFTGTLAHAIVADGAGNVFWTTNNGCIRHTTSTNQNPAVVEDVSCGWPNPMGLAAAPGGVLFWTNVGDPSQVNVGAMHPSVVKYVAP